MIHAKHSLALMMCIAVAAVTTRAQVPQRDVRKPATTAANAAPAPEGKGTLAGMVVADASGAPVRLAYVVLIGATTGVLKVTSSDQEGKFSFTKLPVDRYTVGASKLPYLGAVAGARRPVRPGVPIVLGEGATVGNVTIRLPNAAAVSGTVFDERGQPAPGVAVGVMQRKMQNGERTLMATGPTTFTDDRGVYRIYGLAPGEYVVSAVPLGLPRNARALTDADVDAALRGTPLPPATAGPDPNTAYAPVYFPGTTRLDDAQPLLLAAGEDRQNVDLRIERVRTARIDGTVVRGDGQPLQGATVSLFTTVGTSARTISPQIRVGPDGRFGMTSAPGSATVIARTPESQGNLFAFAVIDMAGVDVTNLQLTLQPALSIAGVLKASGSAAPPTLAGHLIQMRPLIQAASSALRTTPTTATGQFTVSGLVPGRYVFTGQPSFGASAASTVWGFESVWVDGKDVTDLPITISPDAMPKEVSVVLGDRWQELSGRLMDATSAGVSDYTVMVFPVNPEYWVFGSRRVVTAQPATDGRFTLGGPGPSLLPAGEYYLAAVTDVTKDEQYDPAFLQSLIASSLKITLQPGGRQTQDLRVK